MMHRLTILSMLLATTLGTDSLTLVGRGDDLADIRPQVALDARGHIAWISGVFLDRYGGQLYSTSHDKTVRVWDMETYEPLRVIRPPIGIGLTGEIYAASLSADESMLSVSGHMAQGNSNDHDVLVISMPGADKLHRLSGNRGPIRDVAFSPDCKWLAAAGDDAVVRIWDTNDWKLVKQYRGHTDRIMDIDWSPDSTRLVSGSWDKTCRIWDIIRDTSVTLVGHSKSIVRASWSHDGKTIASGGADLSIFLWDDAGRFLSVLTTLPTDVHTLVFSPDDKLLLYGYGTRRNHNHGAGIIRIADRMPIANFPGHTDTPMTGTFTRDGKRAIIGDADGDICVWSVPDGRLLRRLSGAGGKVHGNGWSADGRSVAYGYPHSPGLTMHATTPLHRSFTIDKLDFGPTPDYTFHRAQRAMGSLTITEVSHRVVSVQSYGQTISQYQIPFPDERVRSCTLLPGNRAAVGCRYGLITFDALTGSPIYTLPGHSDTVFAIAPSPNNKYLLSGGDHTLEIWNIDNYQLLLSLFFAGEEWIAWTPEGYYAASVAGETLMGWHVQRSDNEMAEFYPASRFHAEFYRPDVIRKIVEAGTVRAALQMADTIRGRDRIPTTIKASLPPTVTLQVSEEAGDVDGQTTFHITAAANSANKDSIRSVRLLVDGRPGEEIRLPNIGSSNSSQFDVKLESGTHQLAARAETEKSVGISETVDVDVKGDAAKLPRLFVLALGISHDQQNKGGSSSPLTDADLIADLLGGQKTSDFSEILVHKLTGSNATRDAVNQGLEWLEKYMKRRDVAVIFYSGRVARDEHQNLYFTTSDSRLGEWKSTSLPDSFLQKQLQKTAGRLLLMMDCETISDNLANTSSELSSSHTQQLVYDLLRKLATEDFGVATIGTLRDPSTFQTSASGGLLAQAILAGLHGRADRDQNGVIDATELETFVKVQVKETSNGQQRVVATHPELLRTFPIMRP